MSLQIIEDANRCLNCKKPMCQEFCPVHTPIPQVIALFKERKLMEAGERLFENNPMSVICATVCDHSSQCAGHCALGRKGTPVQFYEIEKFVSDAYLDRMRISLPKEKKQEVAIVGSGPAGMTAAFILAKRGYQVTIFEEKSHIGGMLYYGIPDFRLPKSILGRYKSRLQEMGVQIRPNTVIGGALTIDDMFRDGYAAVFLATGTWRPKTLGIRGESLANVHYGVSYLSNPRAYTLGERVAVIGMGNVAMDVARTALRNGAREVTLYARSKRVAASAHEVEYTQLDGASMVFGMEIAEITKEGPVFKQALFDEEDRVIGYKDELKLVSADSVIIAASQKAKNKIVSTTTGLEASENGLLVCDAHGRTTKAGVFAAGDVVHGARTVVHAVDSAKRAVDSMIQYLEEQNESCSSH